MTWVEVVTSATSTDTVAAMVLIAVLAAAFR